MEQLLGIANQCSFEGCGAIINARAMLQLVGDYNFDDRDMCDPEQYAFRQHQPTQKNTTKKS